MKAASSTLANKILSQGIFLASVSAAHRFSALVSQSLIHEARTLQRFLAALLSRKSPYLTTRIWVNSAGTAS